MPTKVKELKSIVQAGVSPVGCPICDPKRGRVREDQVWGNCPTNRKHGAGARGHGLTGAASKVGAVSPPPAPPSLMDSSDT